MSVHGIPTPAALDAHEAAVAADRVLAQTGATTATAQAVIATAQAVVATAQAVVATAQAAAATTQAGLAATAKTAAELAETNAETAETLAEAHLLAVQVIAGDIGTATRSVDVGREHMGTPAYVDVTDADLDYTATGTNGAAESGPPGAFGFEVEFANVGAAVLDFELDLDSGGAGNPFDALTACAVVLTLSGTPGQIVPQMTAYVTDAAGGVLQTSVGVKAAVAGYAEQTVECSALGLVPGTGTPRYLKIQIAVQANVGGIAGLVSVFAGPYAQPSLSNYALEADYVPRIELHRTKSANYVVQAIDLAYVIFCTATLGIELPTGLATGFVVRVVNNAAAASISFTAGLGASVVGKTGAMAARGDEKVCRHIGGNVWVLSGN